MTVSLTNKTYTVIEGGRLTVSAVLSSDSQGRLERDLVVTMETADGTATQCMLHLQLSVYVHSYEIVSVFLLSQLMMIIS